MYESGNEDKINDENNTVEIINDSIKQKELEDLQRENQTLKQMVENRNQEIKKEPTQDKIQVLAATLGIDKINERLDELNKNDNYLVQEMSKIVNAINQIGQNISGAAAIPQGETPAIGDPIQKMELLSNLFDKGLQLYTVYKQNQTPPNPQQLIDPEYINTKVKNSIMGNFELGEALIDSLKSKVINKALTKTVSQIIDNDEPA